MFNRPELPAVDDLDRPVFWKVKQPSVPAREKPSRSLSRAGFYYPASPIMKLIGQLLSFFAYRLDSHRRS